MAKIVVLEDDADFQNRLAVLLKDHEIVRTGTTLGEAFRILGELASGEVEADFILIDGTLQEDEDRSAAEFRYSPAVETPTIPQKRRWLRGPHRPHNPEIVVTRSDWSPRDAPAVMKVMELCGISVKTIGISLDPLISKGVDVTYDLTKPNISELPSVITQLQQES